MPITLRPSKKRRLLNTPGAKLRRKAYSLEHKNPAVRRTETKYNKAYYKKNRNAILKKQALTRKARRR